MKIECVINNIKINRDVNSHIPLSVLINELFIDEGNSYSNCTDGKCSKCLVAIEDEGIMPSCLIPAFKLNGKVITTCDEYMKTQTGQIVLKVFKMLNITPCPECFKSKVMIIGEITESLLKRDEFTSFINDSNQIEMQKRDRIVEAYLKFSNCKCMLITDIYSVVDKVLQIRRNMNGR